MKNKNTYRILILIFTIIIGLWGIPALVKIATVSPPSYPFIYYSSVLQEFCFRETEGKKVIRHDASGNIYSEEQFDSVLPMLNFRQLMVNDRMPDSINGREIPIKEVRVKNFVFKYNTTDMNSPQIGLYIMYEAMSGRVKLESPGDLFRIKEKIEFIDAETNQVNEEKSALFQNALEKAGFQFPAQWASGNLNIKKPYDEGYFTLDHQGNLFHIKLVNKRPFIRNTGIGSQIDVAHFSMLEVADKRFYGFVFDKNGQSYIIEEGGGKYNLKKLDIDPVHLEKDEMMIMGNMLYWTVAIINKEGKRYFALDNETLKRVDEYEVKPKINNWDKVSKWLFPVYLTFSENESNFVYPHIHFTGLNALLINIILALCIGIGYKRSLSKKILNILIILITGIAGTIAIFLIPDFDNKTTKK